jgi:hypothetical protein
VNLLRADACVGVRIVPATNNDVIIAAAITNPIGCFLLLVLFFFNAENYFDKYIRGLQLTTLGYF